MNAKAYEKLTDEEKWPILVKAFHANRRSLLRMPGVTAVDIGYKIVDDVFTDTLAVRLHVERKLPDDLKLVTTVYKIRPCDFVPKHDAPEETKKKCFKLKHYDYVPTDVIEADYKPMQSAEPPKPRMMMQEPRSSDRINRRRRIDPLVGGISIGSAQTPVGTLGALVWDNTDGSVCILSNWHVLAGDLGAEAGAPCFQPGRFDQGRSSDVVALLKRWRFDRYTDAALAELTGSRHYCAGEIISLDRPISGVADPYLGMPVYKFGRSTGATWGFIDGLYFSSAIEYSDGIVQVFENQIHIAPPKPDEPISDPGDSGSVWVSEKNEAVGLHFAGDLPHSAFGEYALANPMKLVMKALNFSFRPKFLEIRDEDLTPPPPMPVEHHGNGIHPVGNLRTRLTGSGGQPDPIRIGSS
jgi:endonuclease G